MRKNLHSGDIEFDNDPPWGKAGNILTDEDILHLKHYIAIEHKKDISTQKLNEAVVIVANMRAYHPLKEYLEGLDWDNIKRLDKWLIEICGCDDNQYYRDVGRKLICGAIWRILSPGCKFDFMAILEGDQGIGKSTLLNILGGNWYLDTHLSSNENKKDIVDMMRTAWIIEISDLAGFRKQDIEHLKSFISRKVDRVRLSYARRSEDFKRQCIFIGTHNPSGDNTYFKDDTGNRRFLPVVCKKIDLNKMREWRDQIFAEAMWVAPIEKLYLENQDSIDYLSKLHQDREVDTPLNDMIGDYLTGKNYVSNKEIMEKVFHLDVGRLSFTEIRSKSTVIGIWMRKNGWKRGENKKRSWYFKDGFEYIEIGGVAEQGGWDE